AGLHDYRIERVVDTPSTDRIRYVIDGAVVAEHVVPTVPATLYVYQEAGGQALPALVIDHISVLPAYVPSGTFTSCAFDAGRTTTWATLRWIATVPAGTSLAVRTRTSDDGVTWSA